MSYVAFQYAEALFALALEEDKVPSVKESLFAFVEAQDEYVYKFLNHPKVKKNDKKEVIAKLEISSLVKNFVYVLIDNNRVDLLSDVVDEFKKIDDRQNKIMNVVVYSGKLMEIKDLNKLKNNIAMKHNRTVNIENIVEETIVGGLRIEYDGMILDETINNYLNKMKNNLTK
jgi:F-type H+-transporting ATPase subunit delta